MEHRSLTTLVAASLALAACARPDAPPPREERSLPSGAADAGPENPVPSAVPREARPVDPRELAGDAAPREEARDEAPLGASPLAWDSEHHVTVTFAPTPEPPGFPVGAFRAATKMCLAETKTVVTTENAQTLVLDFGTNGHVSRVQFAGTEALAEPLKACLRKLYAKVGVGKTKGPLSVSLTLTP